MNHIRSFRILHRLCNTSTHNSHIHQHLYTMSNISSYVICKHTCTECICKSTDCRLWPRSQDHGTATRHAVNPRLHKTCNDECPGYQYLDYDSSAQRMQRSRDAVYEASPLDIQLYLPTPVTINENIIPDIIPKQPQSN